MSMNVTIYVNYWGSYRVRGKSVFDVATPIFAKKSIENSQIFLEKSCKNPQKSLDKHLTMG